jgi:putative oxidoreductase
MSENQTANVNTFVESVGEKYRLVVSWLNYLQSPFLLLLRLYFFWQLFQTGQGKLSNIGKVSEFFASLGIPLPTLNAYFIGSLECFGGLLLIAGLASRPLALLIVISMTVAYLTANPEAVTKLFSIPPHPHQFFKADPFPFLLAALIILAFGPGKISIDVAIAKWFDQKRGSRSSQRATRHDSIE